MCACRQKTSFFIEDILKDHSVKNVTNKNLSHDPTKVLTRTKSLKPINKDDAPPKKNPATTPGDDKTTKFNVVSEVQKELELSSVKVNLDQRRKTYPLYPTPLKANVPWSPYRVKDSSYQLDVRHPFSYFSEPILNSEQILRNHLTGNRFMPTHPFAVRQAYGFDRGEKRRIFKEI